MALQIRRGTNAVRLATLLAQGEPFYVTDYTTANVGPFWIGNGTTYGGVQVTPGQKELMNDMSDVYVTSPIGNQHLVWDSATSRWVNKSNITVPGTLTAGNIDITGPITTNDNFFTLNNDNTTLSGTNNGFTLKRGNGAADVWIRYNASTGVKKWEYTHDGVNYQTFPDQTFGTTSDVRLNSLVTTSLLKTDGNYISLNDDDTTLSGTNNGIQLKRGANPDVWIRYNATTSKWEYTNDGTTYSEFGDVVIPAVIQTQKLGLGISPTNELLQIYNNLVSNLSLSTIDGKFVLTNNSADDLLSFNFYNSNRLQFDGGSGKQWFNSGQTGFNTTSPTATVDVNGTIKTIDLNVTGSVTVTNNSTIVGDLAVNGGDITTTSTTANIFNNNGIQTVNLGNGAITEVNIGGTGTPRVQIKPNTIVGASTTQNVFNTVATTVNAFGAANTIWFGKPESTYQFPGTFNGLASNSLYTTNATISNDLTVNNFLTVKGGIKGETAVGETQGIIKLLGGLQYGEGGYAGAGGSSGTPENINTFADTGTMVYIEPTSDSTSYYTITELRPGQIVIIQNIAAYQQGVLLIGSRTKPIPVNGGAIQVIGSGLGGVGRAIVSTLQ